MNDNLEIEHPVIEEEKPPRIPPALSRIGITKKIHKEDKRTQKLARRKTRKAAAARKNKRSKKSKKK